MPTTFELMKIAAAATFREMEDRDFMAFSGAPAGSMIADSHPDVLIIFVPAAANLEGDDDYLEFHGTTPDGEPRCVTLTAARII